MPTWSTNSSSPIFRADRPQSRRRGFVGDTVLTRLDGAAVAGRLQPAGQRQSTGTLAPGMQALLFLHVTLAPNASVPQKLSHRIAARISAAPPGRQEMRESGEEILVRKSDVVTIGPPLTGTRFIAGFLL